MEKRVFLATALSLLIILLYPYYLKQLGVKPYSKREEVISPKTKDDTVYDTVMKDDTVKGREEPLDDTVYDTVIENDTVKLKINIISGEIVEAYSKEFGQEIQLYPLNDNMLGLFSPTVSTVSFNPVEKKADEIVLQGEGYLRRYQLKGRLLILNLEQEREVLLSLPRAFSLPYREQRYLRLVFKSGFGKVASFKPSGFRKKSQLKDVDWFAISLRHYSFLIDPQDLLDISILPQEEKARILLRISSRGNNIRLICYIGPNSKNILAKFDKNWLSLLDFGLLSNFVKSLLDWLSNFSKSYGLAIIILALFFNLLFVPLTLRSFRSMKQMQNLQPELQALKEKYKDEPQALNKEMLMLYRRYGINPMAGCFPMLLQLPIFIALYNTLMRSYELKTAHFLWIKDLSEPDRFLLLAQKFPLIGNEVNLLPILMALLMFFQQKFSPASKASSSSLWFLPLIFGIIFYKFPAGLVLYWFTNSLFMLGVQALRR